MKQEAESGEQIPSIFETLQPLVFVLNRQFSLTYNIVKGSVSRVKFQALIPNIFITMSSILTQGKRRFFNLLSR